MHGEDGACPVDCWAEEQVVITVNIYNAADNEITKTILRVIC